MGVPTVLSISPADAATGISTRTTIVITFSEAIDSSTVKAGTVVLTDLRTGYPIDLSFSFSSNKEVVTSLPFKELEGSAQYRITVVGDDSGLPAGSIESDATGDALAATTSAVFQTATERFVKLSEVTDRDDIAHIAPIREESELAAATGYISITASSPAAFATDQDGLDYISVRFSEVLSSVNNWDDLLSIELYPILDLEDYLGNYNSENERKLYAEDDTLPITLPTGSVTQTDDTMIWARDTDIPTSTNNTYAYNQFPFNAEILVTLDADVTGISGKTLGQDIRIVFTTELFPMYSGSRTLRLDLGPVLDDYYDDTLNRLVLARSIEAWEIGGRTFATDSPKQMARMYTRWGSLLDAAEIIGVRADINRGTSKELGDFRVDFSNRGFSKDTGRLLTARTKAEAAGKRLVASQPNMQPRTAGLGDHARNGQVVFQGVRNWNELNLGLWYRTTPLANAASERTGKRLIDQGGTGSVYYGGAQYSNAYVTLYRI